MMVLQFQYLVKMGEKDKERKREREREHVK